MFHCYSQPAEPACAPPAACAPVDACLGKALTIPNLSTLTTTNLAATYTTLN